MTGLDSDLLEQCRVRAERAASFLRLPFRRRAWRGVQGNWQGAGTGSSLDFQDHRPYSPGDDPRYINWQAYARSGHYTMKLYRQEVSPTLDLLLDCSESMFVEADKSARVAELLYWTVECAIQSGAALRAYAWRGEEASPLDFELLNQHRWAPESVSPAATHRWPEVPWRHGSLRVVISDLLWPGDPSPVLQRLSDANGFGVVLVPFSRGEAEPDWDGNLEMIDAESSFSRAQRVDGGVMERYRAAYREHFGLWSDQALRYQVSIARVPAELELAEALQLSAGDSGAVEWIA